MTNAKIRTGLVSVTFRKLEPARIVELVAQAKLDGIEWGGDVHVPHGDLARAREVAAMTREAGLRVAAYGSYYRVGASPAKGLAFETVLETAEALGAPVIRVWAGEKGSAAADAEYRRCVIEDARRIAELARQAGRVVAFEHHRGTLTDLDASALRLREEIAAESLQLYWQPPHEQTPDQRRESLKGFLPHLANIHVFHWTEDGKTKHPLAEAAGDWESYLRIAARSAREHFAMLEFVKGDAPEQFLADAATLKGIVERL